MPPAKTPSLLLLAACSLIALLGGCERSQLALGQQIYFDGAGESGRIGHTQGPEWMRFAGVGCIACHGEQGEGLVVTAAGVTGAAPAVTWDALKARGYDEASLRRALQEGIDPHGREFQHYMPRWELSDTEYAALLAYLRSL